MKPTKAEAEAIAKRSRAAKRAAKLRKERQRQQEAATAHLTAMISELHDALYTSLHAKFDVELNQLAKTLRGNSEKLRQLTTTVDAAFMHTRTTALAMERLSKHLATPPVVNGADHDDETYG